ncbi:MBL fold metallo-hydrolase [Pectinatus cerevisiiphilus]|uniref:Phosphoribosyl 1,2-cyclic phosphodiesterase n=1 Tax=Pectinatus cerevisiiphilus TaxID=86956 RepID=A0A4R3KBW6_9FIRM|nr:MBL fold metallo-hydrolase [Pectinatus cerevisiiphilus]TCS80131.1 phosphoribosyl 1,2-cyclic phosphodiesterase [Pectinatus cerevisiiphilus]
MHVSVLASGSKGNSIFVEINNTRLLIDAGISARRISKSLLGIGVDINNIDGIIITHEHRDHINGLPTLCKKYNIPIYSRAATFKAMYCLEKLSMECLHPIKDNFQIGSLSIDAFNTSHDAADPVGYSVHGKQQKCTVATDLGFVTSTVQEAIDESDVLILEANHDQKMLREGNYPWSLKQRIMSNRGHLSNSDAAWALVRMKKHNPYVFLAHMSEENNCPAVAKQTITQIIKQQGINPGEDMTLQFAKQNETVTLPANKFI